MTPKKLKMEIVADQDKKLFFVKVHVKKIKRQAKNWLKIFAKHLSGKWLVSKGNKYIKLEQKMSKILNEHLI